MALENIRSIHGQIQKKKFKEKLSTGVSRLSDGSGGAGQGTIPPQGSGQNDGERTKPGPAGGNFISIDGKYTKTKGPIDIIGTGTGGGTGRASGTAAGGTSPSSGGGGSA